MKYLNQTPGFNYPNQQIYVAYLVYFFSGITIGMAILVVYRLAQRSTSRELRCLVLKRHLIYFVMYFLLLFHVTTHFFSAEFKKLLGGADTFYWLGASLNVVGLILAFTRLFEPYVFSTLKADFRKFFLRKPENELKTIKFETEGLLTFLTSSLNIEYVYLILLGVNVYFKQAVPSTNGITTDRMFIENKRRVSIINF